MNEPKNEKYLAQSGNELLVRLSRYKQREGEACTEFE